MTHWLARVGGAIAGWGLVVLLVGVTCAAAGARVNVTRSIPVGLYWTSRAPVARNATVLVCPPPTRLFDDARRRGYVGAGFCPGNYGFLMKRVAGVAGDAVQIADEGVRVNGTLLPRSAPLNADRQRRTLTRYTPARFTVPASHVLLMSDASATAFDGRYFGPVPVRQIQAVIVPVITW